MSERDPDVLSAVIARQRGRARMRSATIAAGAASLVLAGAVAYHLPNGTHIAPTASTTSVGAASGTSTVHTTSGGSGVAVSTSGRSVSAPSASTGQVHAASGGS